MYSIPKKNTRYYLGRPALLFLAFVFPAYAFFQLASLNTLSVSLLSNFPHKLNFVSNLSALYLLADAAMLIPAGLLLDYITLKRIFPLALSILVAGVLITAQASSTSGFYAGRLFMGIGHAFAFLTGFKIVRHCASLKHRSISMGLVVTSAMLGGFLAQSPLGYLARTIGWHSAMLLNGLIGLCILIFSLVALKEFSDCVISRHDSPIIAQLLKSIKNPINTMLGIIMGLLSSPLIIIGSTWGAQYLIHVDNLSVHQAEFASSTIFIGTILGISFFGWLSDRSQKIIFLLKISVFLGFIGSILIVSTSIHNYYFTLSLFIIIALLCGSQTLCYVLISHKNTKETQNTAMAFANVILMLISSTLPMFFSALSKIHEKHVLDIAAQLSFGMLLIPITLITAIIMLILIQKKIR